MTAALNKEAMERKAKEQLEEAKRKKVAKKAVVKENALLALTAKNTVKKKVVVPPKKVIKKAPVKKIVKPAPIVKKKTTQAVVSRANLAKKLAAKLAKKTEPKPKAVIASSPAPFLDGAPPSSAQLVSVSTNETSEQELQEEKPQEKGANKTKLYDGSVNQVIEEVQTEQEAKIAEQKYKSALTQTQ